MEQILTGALVLKARLGNALVRLRAQFFSARPHYVSRIFRKTLIWWDRRTV